MLCPAGLRPCSRLIFFSMLGCHVDRISALIFVRCMVGFLAREVGWNHQEIQCTSGWFCDWDQMRKWLREKCTFRIYPSPSVAWFGDIPALAYCDAPWNKHDEYWYGTYNGVNVWWEVMWRDSKVGSLISDTKQLSILYDYNTTGLCYHSSVRFTVHCSLFRWLYLLRR